MLNLNHVCKSLGDSQILTDINLSVGSGEVVALIGKNGVGKTTLVNVACGYLIPDSGSVYTDSIACVPQELDKSKSVTDLFSKGVIDWQKQAVLDKVGLKGVNLNDPIDVLSGGQQTRLAFAVALAGDSRPDTLVLDEPTNNLDREMVGWLHDFINDYQGGVLMVSHDRAFNNDVATIIIELNSHGIKEYGGNYDFYKNQKKSESFAEMKLYSDYIDEK
ncbi:ABC-F family ATP-binding cassette domain-containing protein, partial [Candidatus Saccharibacteria bacterium]|nr:ABC-F family ATP-binding cassette domain-containing protein [Candidatus Saccharibacteria bacterium]